MGTQLKELGYKIASVAKGTYAGVKEDITHNKASKGIGKWNPKSLPQMKPKAKTAPKKAGTPERMSLSPKRAVDIKRKVKQTKEALKY